MAYNTTRTSREDVNMGNANSAMLERIVQTSNCRLPIVSRASKNNDPRADEEYGNSRQR